MDGTVFKGRDEALELLQSLLLQGERVLVVTGPAGIGKTRLSQRFAYESPRAFDVALGEGTPVVWCDCAHADDEAELLCALAQNAGAPLTGDAPLDRLVDALSLRGSVLLVLDHVVAVEPTRALVARLCAACPELRVLLTARAPLGVEHEAVVALGPLDAASGATLWTYHGGPTATPALLQRLSAAVGGNPLALELLARVDAREPVEARVAALEARAAGGALSIDDVLEVLWATLRPREQACLAEAALFAGGFSMEAAEAVLSVARGSQTALPILLADFRGRALVRVRDESARQVRFSLDAAVREHAARELARVHDRDGARARYVEHFLTRGESLLADVVQHGSFTAERTLTLERANLRAAGARAGDSDRLRASVCLLVDAVRWGPVEPLLADVDAALEAPAPGGASPLVLAMGWTARAWRRSRAGDHAGSLAAVDRALTLGRRELAGHCLHAAALMREAAGAVPEAIETARRAIDSFERNAIPRESSCAMVTLGRLLARHGAVDEAASVFARAIARGKEYGAQRAQMGGALLLGRLELDRGGRDEARRQLEAALAACEKARYVEGVVDARGHLARLLHDLGRTDDAAQEFRRAIDQASQLGDRDTVASYEVDLGALLHELGQLAEARALLEATPGRLGPRCPRAAAVARAHLAATLASGGELDAAAPMAEEALAALRDPVGRDTHVARALRVYVILCRAREQPMPEAREVSRVARHELAALQALPSEQWSVALRIALRLVSGFDGDELLRSSEELARPKALFASRMGQWFVPPGGEEVSLRTRSTLSVLLRRLGEQRLAAPGRSLTPEGLIADMWPGEKIIPKAARNRLHVAVRTLRTMGLNTALRSSAEGYYLDPAVPFQFVGEMAKPAQA